MTDTRVTDDTEVVVLADHERWYAAVAYLFFVCFYSLRKGRDSDFVRLHSRQGVVLFFAECAGLLAVLVVDQTIGRVPLLGLLVVIVLQVAVYLSALLLAVMGFVKALFGERWIMPVLGNYADRVPLI